MTALRPAADRPEERYRSRFLWYLGSLAVAVALAILVARLMAGVPNPPGTHQDGTSSGVGGGSAGTSGVSPITINQTAALKELFPGSAPQELSGTFTNAGSAAVFIGAVEASLTGISGGNGSCSLTNFKLANPVMPVGLEVPVGQDVGSWGGATVQMIGQPSSQDGCKRATVQISYRVR